ncbi:MAG: dihydrofolate reductase [Marinilabiliales bacterium]|nr:dihydrofolate reductase [Marinilabiliales bacterium]
MIYENISIIVAIAENFAIGKNNDLLFHLPEDLKRFKKITSGKSLIMGKRTFFSLPKAPLPNRRNIVITDVPGEQFPGCESAGSIEEALKLVEQDPEAFIIGGGMIYRQFYPIAGRLYLTLVHQTMEADTFFPEIDFNDWDELALEEHYDEANDFHYAYLDLKRKG